MCVSKSSCYHNKIWLNWKMPVRWYTATKWRFMLTTMFDDVKSKILIKNLVNNIVSRKIIADVHGRLVPIYLLTT